MRVLTYSMSLAMLLSLLITVVIYVRGGLVTLDVTVVVALVDIMIFWFPLVWSLTFLIALFRSLKYISYDT